MSASSFVMSKGMSFGLNARVSIHGSFRKAEWKKGKSLKRQCTANFVKKLAWYAKYVEITRAHALLAEIQVAGKIYSA